jgi:hypothetical protein
LQLAYRGSARPRAGRCEPWQRRRHYRLSPWTVGWLLASSTLLAQRRWTPGGQTLRRLATVAFQSRSAICNVPRQRHSQPRGSSPSKGDRYHPGGTAARYRRDECLRLGFRPRPVSVSIIARHPVAGRNTPPLFILCESSATRPHLPRVDARAASSHLDLAGQTCLTTSEESSRVKTALLRAGAGREAG